MKLVFSTKNVPAESYIALCNLTAEYGFDGFELYDPKAEKEAHEDSILRSAVNAAAKRKLINRHIGVSFLTRPEPITEKTDPQAFRKYVSLAARASAMGVVVQIGTEDTEVLKKVFAPAIKKAESNGTMILLETVGALADTKKIIEVIRSFGSAAVGACWNIRETYFRAKEDADTTIQNLGAYINYVRIGDRRDGKDVLIGEGTLPVTDFMNALRSLNYEGYLAVDWNEEITDPDIVLTHFISYISGKLPGAAKPREIFYNRDKTGTFPWKKYQVMDLTFSQVLDEMVERYPDQYAFKYTTLDYTRTYAQFREDVDRTAAALIAMGVKPGHHVSIWATNIPQWFITFWATVKIGAVLVTVNTAYKIHEAEYLFRQSDTHTHVMIENCRDSDYKGIIEELCPELKNTKPGEPLYSKNLPFLRNVITVGFKMDGCLEWDEFVEKGDAIPREEVRRLAAMVKPDDVCNMQYTSGTTGFPKGVMLTHRNIVNNGKTIGDRMDISTADRMMIQVPMFHCFGMVLSMTNLMTHGGTICPMPYFSPKSSLACINDE
ncbi:MAG: AMP-binding protein, partial [Clostridia bacterium]|nr:AMP-binding protein [Clostridia bacterium]